jgi:hypothetical protein
MHIAPWVTVWILQGRKLCRLLCLVRALYTCTCAYPLELANGDGALPNNGCIASAWKCSYLYDVGMSKDSLCVANGKELCLVHVHVHVN